MSSFAFLWRAARAGVVAMRALNRAKEGAAVAAFGSVTRPAPERAGGSRGGRRVKFSPAPKAR